MTATDRFLLVGHPPPDLPEVDLTALPTVYKSYPRAGKVALAAPDPLDRLLRQVNGVTRVRWMSGAGLQGAGRVHDQVTRRAGPGRPRWLVPGRPVPSAGGRYPIEVYVATGATPGRPAGLHHYDPAHHALDQVRAGDGRALVTGHLAQPPAVTPTLVLLLSTVFWRNCAKYGQFGYRLQTLDAGVVIAQIVAVAERLGFDAAAHLRFADEHLDALLGIDGDAEAVLAVVNLSDAAPGDAAPADRAAGWHLPPAPLPPAATRASTVDGLADLVALHQAARRVGATAAQVPPPDVPARPGRMSPLPVGGPGTVELATAEPLDLSAGVSRRRTVSGYHPAAIPTQHLARLLAAATRPYRCDIDAALLYCVALRVDDVPTGVYRYDGAGSRLRRTVAGHPVGLEAAATSAALRDEFRTAGLVVVPVGQFDDGPARYGDRWYRMQNIAAGVLTQRICLGAAALGLDSHISCGFDLDRMDAALNLTGGPLSSLVVITVGTARPDRAIPEVAL